MAAESRLSVQDARKLLAGPKKSKYRAVGTMVGDIWFASKKEAKRFSELKALEAAGEITHLVLQPRYPITIDGIKICVYTADFSYVIPGQGSVCEDVKGMQTRMFRLKKKMFEAQYKRKVLIT